MKKSMKRINLSEYMCVIVFLVLFVFFAISTNGKILSAFTLKAILNQSVTTIMAGLGMIFVICVGGTDISTGSLVAFSAAIAFIVADRLALANPYLEILVMFCVTIGIGCLNGLLIGVINTKFKVPSFMISLSLNIALRGAVSWVLGAKYYLISNEVRALDGWAIKIPVLVVLVAIMWFLLEYTPFGHYCKAVGENENAIKYAGVNTDRIKRIAFVLSGMMAGVAAMFTAARVGGSNNTMASSFEMRVMMALFVASVPVSGGTGTRMYKLLVGAIIINMLESGLTLLGITAAYVQLVRGLVLMVLLVLTAFVMQKDKNHKPLRKRAAEKSKV